MTIEELFEEYKQFARETDPDVSHNPNDCTDCKIMKERMADIIQEIEALVRKEIFEELDAYGLEPRYVLVQCAQSKGITL